MSEEGRRRSAELAAAKDREMEAAARAMNSSRCADYVEDYHRASSSDRQKRDNLSDRLKAKSRTRRERGRRGTLTSTSSDGDETITSMETTITGDAVLVNAAMIDVLADVQQEKREAELRAQIEKLEDVGDEEKRRLFEQYESNAGEVESRFAVDRAKHVELLQAKLTAKRRLREEQSKDKVVAEELKKAQDVQVKIFL